MVTNTPRYVEWLREETGRSEGQGKKIKEWASINKKLCTEYGRDGLEAIDLRDWNALHLI